MIYSNRLPKVSVTEAKIQKLSHIVDAEGTLKAEKSVPLIIIEGLRISDVKVNSGSSVKDNDVLLELDMDYLNKKIAKQEKEIQYQISSMGGAYEETGKRPFFVPENMRITYMCVKAGDTISEQQKLMTVDTDYLYEYIETLKSEIDETNIMREQSLKIEDYASVDLLDSKISGLYKKIDRYQQIAWNDGNIYSECTGFVTDIKLVVGSLTTNEAVMLISDAPVLNPELEEKRAELDKLKVLQENKGLVISSFNGTVSEVFVSPGDFTPMGASFIFSEKSEGFTFSAVVGENDAKFLSPKDSVSISFNGVGEKISSAEISKIQKEDEGIKIEVHIDNPALEDGMIGKLQYTVYSSEPYTCLERSAVRFVGDSDTEGYIFVVSETEGFLGKEYVVRRQNVSIVDSNNKYYGLSSFYIDENEKIVTSSSKELSEGQMVRILK